MPRRPRVFVEGGIYHVYNRFARGADLFSEPEEAIEFIEDLSGFARRIGWQGLYIGDISQPRGGPMTSGHSSHQIGLDADDRGIGP